MTKSFYWKYSFSFTDKTHKFHLSFSEELQSFFKITIYNFNLFFLVRVPFFLFHFFFLNIRFEFKDLILNFYYFISNHFIFSNQITIHIFLTNVFLSWCRVFYKKLFQVLKLYLQGIIIIWHNHVIFLCNFSDIA